MAAATRHNAILFRDAVKKTIRNGRPEWPGVSPLTEGRKGSSKPLIDHGDLMHAVDYVMPSKNVFFVGVPRRAKSGSGKRGKVKMINIAQVLHDGVTIRPKKRRALAIPVTREASKLLAEHRSVRRIPGLFRPKGTMVLARGGGRGGFEILFVLLRKSVIPPRPFITTTFADERPVMLKRFEKALKLGVRGQKYSA